MNDAAATATLPVIVIGGYLGAGKTTLVNRLLRHAAGPGAARARKHDSGGRRIAVLVNDFGEVSIDAELIVGAAAGVLSLAGGCICCSYGADLVGTLAQVAAREPRPHAVLVETSGVGLPAAVARTAALVPQVRVQGIVVVADALALRRQAAERHVGGTVRQQLHEADLVLIAKTDLAAPPAVQALEQWLRELGVAAPCLALRAAAGPDGSGVGAEPGEADDAIAELVFGLAAADGSNGSNGSNGSVEPVGSAFAPRPLQAAGSRFVARTRRFAEPVDVAALGEALRAQGVLRAKGVLLDVGGAWQELHLAGGRVEVRPARRGTGAANGQAGPAEADLADGDRAAAAGRADAAGRLVSIGLRAAEAEVGPDAPDAGGAGVAGATAQ